jgi:hypothetical protein
MLYQMLNYKIARHIIVTHDLLNVSSSGTFPSRDGYINVALTCNNGESTKVRRFKLDPEAPTKVSLTTAPAPKNET